MLNFRNLSIRRKQMLIIMLTSCVVLLLACSAFVAYEIVTFKQELVKKELTVAEVLGNTVTAAIDFNDHKTAEEALGALQVEPHIIAACIYDRDGQVFATYQREPVITAFDFPPVRDTSYEFGGGRLHLFQSIRQSNEPVGTIFVVSDLRELTDRLTRYAGIVGAVLLASVLIALVLSSQLQRVVSDPIRDLAQTARTVALEKNYSVRAKRHSNDELGQLIDGFNEMLAQIQERDAALQAGRGNLERRVEERTWELQNENIERRLAEAALRESQALYHSLVEQLPVGVFRKDRDGRYVFVNPWYCRLKGIKAELYLGKTPLEVAAAETAGRTTDDQRETRLASTGSEHHERILKTGEHIEVEEKYPGPDGKTQYLHVVKSPVYGPDGKIIGTQGILLDITQRKEAEMELVTLHKQLIDASRQAGMAEVATGVLHNVGNVLNSVNVSTSLLTDQIKKSKVNSIARVAAMLRENSKNLAEFITEDPKGRKLPSYLGDLADFLAREQAVALKELAGLHKNVEHIKDIVAMQQNYAKVAGVTQTIQITEVVEDALRMNEGALMRHDVRLVREFEKPFPEVIVDRHKILQILVNLIRNAKYACDESGVTDKRLIVRVANTKGRIHISVIDNGVGIPRENLTRIFNHGFTTRKTGHGFGLHSGALAAKEMGGALIAASDGPGKGAAFTLDLPLTPPTRTDDEPRPPKKSSK